MRQEKSALLTDATPIDHVRPRHETREAMAAEVAEGLRRPLPSLPSTYFYDARGSALFEEITRLPEYYQTRTELAILAACAPRIASATAADELAELGSGDSPKIRALLDPLRRAGRGRACLQLEVDEAALRRSLASLSSAYPGLSCRGVVGDLTRDVAALGRPDPKERRLLLFFGSTIGNLEPADVPGFLRAAAGVLAPGDHFLVGFDLVKDRAVLEAAYNDTRGVTAAFNRNILRVVNDRLGADFDAAGFDHIAFYDEDAHRIEMRLRARQRMQVRIPRAGTLLTFAEGDEIRTEISCKFTRDGVVSLCAGSPFEVVQWRTDPADMFALALLRRR